jgi:hypothetical protein
MGGVVRACYSGQQAVDKGDSSLTFNAFHGNLKVKSAMGQDKWHN